MEEDYKSITRLIEFQPGETLKQISVTINDDDITENNEMLELFLLPGEGVYLSPFPRAVVTIEDDESKLHVVLCSYTSLIHSRS